MIDRNEIKLSLASTTDFYEIKNFLKKNKESGASRNDLIYIVRYQTKLIGLVRLIGIEDSITPQYWLRGLFIEPEYRQLHLASQLLDFMSTALTAHQNGFQILAFPYIHLNHFYESNGYHAVGINLLPPSLLRTYQNAINLGKTWLCMAFIR